MEGRIGQLVVSVVAAACLVSGQGHVTAEPVCTTSLASPNTVNKGIGFGDGYDLDGDGDRVVFSSIRDYGGNSDGDNEIWLRDLSDGTIESVTDDSLGNSNVTQLSIDDAGDTLMWTQGANGPYPIHVYDVGSGQDQVVATGYRARLARNGASVLFRSNENLDGSNPDLHPRLWTVGTDGSGLAPAVAGESWPNEIAISGDGSRVFWTSTSNVTGGGSGSSVLYTALLGGSPTQVSPSGVDVFLPSVDFDGGAVAVRSDANLTGENDDRSQEVFRHTSTGWDQISEANALQLEGVAISDDGNRVAWHESGIWVWDAAGDAVVAVGDGLVPPYPGAALSGDGEHVLHMSASNIGSLNPDGNRELWISHCTAPVTAQPDAQIASAANGPFKGIDLYDGAPTTRQTKSASIERLSTRTFYVRVRNDGATAASFRVRGVASGSPGYTVRYLRGATDISTQVRGGSYQIVGLAPGGIVTLKIKITASAAARGSSRTVDLTVKSAGDPSIRDVVRARVTRPS